jgi:hypothetical protein
MCAVDKVQNWLGLAACTNGEQTQKQQLAI